MQNHVTKDINSIVYTISSDWISNLNMVYMYFDVRYLSKVGILHPHTHWIIYLVYLQNTSCHHIWKISQGFHYNSHNMISSKKLYLKRWAYLTKEGNWSWVTEEWCFVSFVVCVFIEKLKREIYFCFGALYSLL